MKDASDSPILKELARKQAGSRPARWPAGFVLSAGAMLALASAGCVLMVLGKFQGLEICDPLFGVRFGYLLLVAGIAGLLVAGLCLLTRKRNLGLGLLACLTLDFVLYRAGLWTMGWHHPWVFVGGMTSALNISPVLADGILLAGALYLLAGSAILLLLPQKKPSAVPEAG